MATQLPADAFSARWLGKEGEREWASLPAVVVGLCVGASARTMESPDRCAILWLGGVLGLGARPIAGTYPSLVRTTVSIS